MANQFTNTGFATILKPQTQGVYNTLLWGKKQLQQNKEFQAKQRAAVDDHNYKLFKDFYKLDFKGLDASHRVVLKKMTDGYMTTALDAYKQSRETGKRIDPTFLARLQSDVISARDIMLSHQQGMQELNQLYKQNPDLYSEDMLKDAFSQMYKTDEEGKIDVNSPNLEYSAQDLKKLASDPKYVNYGYGVNKFVEDMGKTISSKFSTFKDPNSGEFFDREEDFESYKRLVEMGENGRPKISEKTGLPIFKDSQAVLAEMAISPDPEIQTSYKALLHNAKQQGISAVDLLDKELAPMRTSDLKKQDNTRIARTTVSKKKEDTPNIFNLVQGGSGEFESGNKIVTGSSIPMPSFVNSILLNYKDAGSPVQGRATFEGLEFNPETQEKSFTFSAPRIGGGLIKVYKPIKDEKTKSAILNLLDDGSAKEQEFLQSLDAFEEAQLKEVGYTESAFKTEAENINQLVREGDFETAMTELKALGLLTEDVKDMSGNLVMPREVSFQKSGFWNADSHQIVIDGKTYFTKDDKEEIIKLLQEKIKQANPVGNKVQGSNEFENVDTADDIH